MTSFVSLILGFQCRPSAPSENHQIHSPNSSMKTLLRRMQQRRSRRYKYILLHHHFCVVILIPTQVVEVEVPTNEIQSLIDEVDAFSHPLRREFSSIHLLDSLEDLNALAQTLCTRLRSRYESVCRYRIWSTAPRLPVDDSTTKQHNETSQV